jgi:hypothetical protein
MKKIAILFVFLFGYQISYSQQNYYDITPGDGYGARFWSSDLYKIHMGNSSEYHFGPVTDYSIKMNMSPTPIGRGWTWGVAGQIPIAGLSNVGHMTIAGDFTSNGSIRTGSGLIGSSTNNIQLMNGAGTDDNNYEWVGFYSGASRQGIILYDGAWTGANNLTNEFSLTAENGNKLSLNTDGSDIGLMPDGNGKVGVGTLTPESRLHVTDVDRMGLQLGGPSTSQGAVADLIFKTNDGNKVGDTKYWYWSFRTDTWSGYQGDLVLYANDNSTYTSPIIIQTDGDVALATGAGSGRNGNVGIGTINPDSKLTVKGVIHAEEVKVDLSVPGPDYVFEADYSLTSLEDTKVYIEQNKHLPGIPSSDEMQQNGVNLLEMNMKLLEKVEELTLHLIEQQRVNKEQGERINYLEQKIK